MKIVKGFDAAKSILLQRPSLDFSDIQGTREQAISVAEIIDTVQRKGDSALFDYSRTIDHIELSQLEVTSEEISQARKLVSDELVNALYYAADRIQSFHHLQKEKLGLEFTQDGIGFVVRPIERVGVYVPGGKASYPSTVLMTVIPATVAGVDDIVITTPPSKNGRISPITLVAADIVGVKCIFKVGGAQAIAALAFGTESIPKVDKICGPGNIYVTLAKKQVYGAVAIDGLHGPTETVIIADDSANAVYCASDLLAQAEHDEMASAILITASSGFAEEVSKEIERQLEQLDRKKTARVSLERNGLLLVVQNENEAIELANVCAAEHLCLSLKNGSSYLGKIRHAGGVFIDTAEAFGDYTAGPSHVMPTGRTARFSSPLSVLDFLKVSIVVDLHPKLMQELGPVTAAIARAEGLTAHALSIERRLEDMVKTE